jgi:hypothetical protein
MTQRCPECGAAMPEGIAGCSVCGVLRPAGTGTGNSIKSILLPVWTCLCVFVVLPATFYTEVLPGEDLGPVGTGDMWPVALVAIVAEGCLLWFAFRSRK